MKYCILFCLLIGGWGLLTAATIPAPSGYSGTWPPTWVGVTKGGNATAPDPNPTAGDNNHEFDYGQDEWGHWANLEVGTVVVEMRYVPVTSPDYGNGTIGGAFLMGAPPDEQGAREHEKPQVEVPLTDINSSNGMWVSADECSQALWREITTDVMDDTTQASYIGGEEELRSVDRKNFTEVTNFCSALGTAIGRSVSLPSEKEWEFLCRSGTATAFYTGRILDGFTGFSNAGLSTTASDFMYDFDRGAMDAGKLNVPSGDGFTPPWVVRIDSVDGDGIARWNQWNHFDAQVCGTITVNGSSTLGMNIVAQFDSRFQWRYAPDHYGTHAPILMLYYYDGTNYLPRPFGDPSLANMYYRYLEEPKDYVLASTVHATGVQNHDHSNGHKFRSSNPAADPANPEFLWQDPKLGGDWVPDPVQNIQLEYREMIHVTTRYNPVVGSPNLRNVNMAEWEEAFDGGYMLVEDPGLATNTTIKRMYPIHGFYTRHRFYTTGTETFQSLPIVPTNDQIEEQARSIVPDNQKGKNGPLPEDDMTVEDYVFNYWEAISKHYDDNNFDPGFWVATTQHEIDNINKADIVAMEEFTGFGITQIKDKITVVGMGGVTSTIAANGRSPWGFLNMHGNLEEWTTTTWDGKSSHLSHSGGSFQVSKGGSWQTSADRCRSAARTPRKAAEAYDDVGFRFIIRN